MSEMTRFEDDIADELGLMAGPEPSVDALAVARSVAALAPKRRFTTMYTAFKFALVAALLALTGGLLAAGALQLFDNDERVLDSEAPIPSYTFEKLPIGPVDSGAGWVTQLPSGAIVVAGGDGAGTNLMWSSADGGANWTETPLEVGFETIVALDDGLVGLSMTEEGTTSGLPAGNQIWTSDDGLTWELTATLESADIQGLRTSPDGLVAVGWDHRPDETTDYPRGYPTMWTSPDGQSWVANQIAEPLPVGEPSPGDWGWDHFLRQPVRADDGTWLVAAEYTNDTPGIERVIFWRSIDGIDWELAWDPEGETGLGTLATAPSGFVATVSTADESGGDWVTRTMTSVDGLEWQTGADPDGSEFGYGETLVRDSAGPIILPFHSVFETVGLEEPEYVAFADSGPIDVPLVRFVEGEGWVASESGITNAAIWHGSATPDGRLLLVGQDLSACESSACLDEEGGDRPALWLGTPQ